jgi:hypothetical protein
MKILTVSYSFTGNNEALAKSVAKELTAEHLIVTEPKTRTMGGIVLDMLFNRTPKVQSLPNKLGDYDLILFFAPIWMGQVASPIRAYLKELRVNSGRYAFASISGGADGGNPKLMGELNKRTGREPIALIDLPITSLLPPDQHAARKDTSAYRIDEKDIKKLTDTILQALKDKI